MAERMQQAAFQESAFDDPDLDAGMDVEDDDSPDDAGTGTSPGSAADPGLDARHSHVVRRARRPDSMTPRDGSVIGNRYRVESVAHRDGATIVLRAHHLELGTKATIRYLSPRAARRGDAVNRFLRGARASARVQSEHVARVTDIGRFGLGVPFVVTEAIEGWTLEEVLRVRGSLPVQEAVEYVVQAASGVAAAHAAGVVHGALNLRHLVLSRRVDGSPLIRVEALGAGHAGDLVTTPGSSSDEFAHEATVSFLAPEQVRATGDVDVRADVWALGALLHALLSGAPPFSGATGPAVLAAVAADAPLPLADLRRDVAPGLESAVLQCLAKDRDERFASVADLLVALRPFASGDAVAVLDRVSRATTRPPPLPGAALPAEPARMPPPPAAPRARSIVPVPSRPPPAPEASRQSFIAVAAGVGAGVGAAVALVLAVVLRVGAPAVPQGAVVAPLAVAPTATPSAQQAPSATTPVPAAPMATAPAAAVPTIPAPVAAAAAAPATPQPKAVTRKPEAPRAAPPVRTTTEVATKAEPVAGRSEGDLFDDPR